MTYKIKPEHKIREVRCHALLKASEEALGAALTSEEPIDIEDHRLACVDRYEALLDAKIESTLGLLDQIRKE